MALIRLNNQSISSVTALPSGIDTGKVLQYKFTTNQSQLSKVGTSGNVNIFTDLTITPVSSTSKFYVQFNSAENESKTNTADSIRFELLKNGSFEHTFSTNDLYRSASEERGSFTGFYTAIVNQSSSFTLNVGFRNGNYSGTAVVCVNNSRATLAVFEIAD